MILGEISGDCGRANTLQGSGPTAQTCLEALESAGEKLQNSQFAACTSQAPRPYPLLEGCDADKNQVNLQFVVRSASNTWHAMSLTDVSWLCSHCRGTARIGTSLLDSEDGRIRY